MIKTNYPLSEAMQRFVEQSDAFFPPDVVKKGLSAQRAAYDAMAQHFSPPHPTQLTVTDGQLNGVAIRRYQPCQRIQQRQVPQHHLQQHQVLFVHGGGWYLGGLDSHDSFCASLAVDCNIRVVAIDYRLAPEAPYPAGLDDLMGVYQALLAEEPLPPLLMGDSAGGNLVAALTLRCRQLEIQPACGQVLIYPALAIPGSLPSHQLLANAPLLDNDSLTFCWHNYSSNASQNTTINPELSPLQAKSLALLPPASIIAAEFDPLVDDARQYSQRLKQAGIAAQLTIIPGLVHGALRAIATTEGQRLYQKICADVARLTTAKKPI